MLTILNLLLLCLIIFPLYILSMIFKGKPVPKGLKKLPGPAGWPLVGNIFSFNEPLCKYLYKVSKDYGPVVKFTMGCREIVVLSNYRIVSKALKEMGNNFSGRFNNVITKTHNAGLVLKDKEWWVIQRSFVLRVLKDFGLGKQRSNEIVSQECSILMKDIEDGCGKIVSARSLFPKCTVNVIAKLVMNMRFEKEEKNFKSLTTMIEKNLQNRNIYITLLTMYPILENFPRFINFLLWWIGRKQEMAFQHNFIEEIINEHKKQFNTENEGEDLIDMFLKQQHELNQNNVKNHTFTDIQIIRLTFELFVAGYETTSTTLTWSMLMLAKYPEIQEKIHREILNVIGADRMPNLSDKKSLQYTQAVMDEILRFTSVVPLSVAHRVFESTELDGFFIPKDSLVFPNLFACHRDKDIWEHPFDFYPEHFLLHQENGIKYNPRDELIPFGIGKRQCLGEALARTEFFVFFTSIFQRFKVRLDSSMSEETFSKITQGTDGGIRAPLSSDVIFEMRL